MVINIEFNTDLKKWVLIHNNKRKYFNKYIRLIQYMERKNIDGVWDGISKHLISYMAHTNRKRDKIVIDGKIY